MCLLPGPPGCSAAKLVMSHISLSTAIQQSSGVECFLTSSPDTSRSDTMVRFVVLSNGLQLSLLRGPDQLFCVVFPSPSLAPFHFNDRRMSMATHLGVKRADLGECGDAMLNMADSRCIGALGPQCHLGRLQDRRSSLQLLLRLVFGSGASEARSSVLLRFGCPCNCPILLVSPPACSAADLSVNANCCSTTDSC